MKSVSFIICNSQNEDIEEIVRVFESLAQEMSVDYEILVYGQAGNGRSEKLYGKTSFFYIHETHGCFLPMAVRDGFKRAQYDNVFLMCELELVPVSSVKHLLEGLNRYDMILGSRLRHEQHFRMLVYRWGWHKLIRNIFKIHVNDINCPWKAFTRDKLQQINYFEGNNTLIHTELVAKAWAKGLNIAEIPVHKYYPMHNPAERFGTRDVLRNLWQLVKLKSQIAKEAGRVENESSFHDDWALQIDVADLNVEENFTAITAPENRYALEVMGDIEGCRILDIGCGAGETSVFFAKQGAQVTALDISEQMIAVTRRLAEKHRVQVDASTMMVEDMDLPDKSFDYVFGNGVLHHLNCKYAYREIHRVLKPGGRAIFIEPLCHNPLIAIYRLIASTVRTRNEHPFKFKDFKTLEELFVKVSHREFWLTTQWLFMRFFLIEHVSPRKERYWKKIIADAERLGSRYKRLEKVDRVLLKSVPWLRRFCWNTVMVLEKEQIRPDLPLVEQWMESQENSIEPGLCGTGEVAEAHR